MAKQTPELLALPGTHNDVKGLFWRPNDAFIDELTIFLKGRVVLEIFAGNGYLAGVLASRGIKVIATSQLSGMDAHEHGIYHPVRDMDAVDAVIQLGQESDVLLMSWPTTTRRAFYASKAWGAQRHGKGLLPRPIVFIGEVTNYAKGHLGGCATDEFFEDFVPEREFAAYRGSVMEKAMMGVMR